MHHRRNAVLCFCALTTVAAAQSYPPWQSLGAPVTPRYTIVQGFARHPDGTIFAAHVPILRTTDRGSHWDSIPGAGLPAVLRGDEWRIATGPDSALFAVLLRYQTDTTRVFRSRDRGNTWTLMSAPLRRGGADVVIATNHTGTVFTGTYNRHDGGGKWEGCNRSTDGGATWAVSVTAVADTFITAFACTPDSTVFMGGSVRVYRSRNDGNSWTPVLGAADAPLGVHGIATDNAGRVFVASNTGVHRSTDGGESWIALVNGLPENTAFRSIAACANGRVCAASVDGIFCSTNSGETWAFDCDGLPDTTGAEAMIDDSCGAVFAAGSEETGIVVRNAGTGTWNQTNDRERDATVVPGSIAVSPRGTLWVLGNDSRLYYHSTMGWARWSANRGYLDYSNAWLRAISDSVFAASVNDRITVTGDAGAHWIGHFLGSRQSEFDGNGRLYAIDGGNAWRSDDTGRTWSSCWANPSGSNGIVALAVDGDRVRLVLNQGLLFTSTDRGATWVDSVKLPIAPYSVAPLLDTALLALGYEVYPTLAVEWCDSNFAAAHPIGALPGDHDGVPRMATDRNRSIILAMPSGTVYRSADACKTWEQDNAGLTIRAPGLIRSVVLDAAGNAYLNTDSTVFMQRGALTSVRGDDRFSRMEPARFEIAPNPASAIVAVRAGARRAELVDLLGRVVARPFASLTDGFTTIFQFNVAALSPGLYVMRGEAVESVAARVVVVQR